MTPDEFWTEFRKVASRFSVGENGLIRSEEMRCPICEVAYEKTGEATQENYSMDMLRIGMSYRDASLIADAADRPLALPHNQVGQIRVKMLAIIQEAKG